MSPTATIASDAAPSPWLRHFERRVEAREPPAPPSGDDPVLLQVRVLFVELYRLVWSLQLGVPAGETPDLQLREHRGAFGGLSHLSVSSVRHGHYAGRLAPGMRRTLLTLTPVTRAVDESGPPALVAVRVEPIGALLCEELSDAFGEPIGRDEQGMTFAELSFRTKPVAFMDAVVRQLLALGVRPGEVAL
jgi:hypothetical protein